MALFQLTLNSSLRSMMQMTLSWQSLMKAMKRRTFRWRKTPLVLVLMVPTEFRVHHHLSSPQKSPLIHALVLMTRRSLTRRTLIASLLLVTRQRLQINLLKVRQEESQRRMINLHLQILSR